MAARILAIVLLWLVGFGDLKAEEALPAFDGNLSIPAVVGAQPPFFLPVSPSAPGAIPIVSPSPMIPVLPNPSSPKLSGHCKLNFSALTPAIDRTAQDCLAPLALYVGEVICCPQLQTLFRLAQGHHSNTSGRLTFNRTEASYCFSDISSLLVSKGANTTVSEICSLEPKSLTGGQCPVYETKELYRLVNTSRLLGACKGVDPLKECCKPVCQPALEEAALQLASNGSFGFVKQSGLVPASADDQVLEDCKDVVLAWVAGQLNLTESNTALRNLFSCKVNKACPLVFSDVSAVVDDCHGLSPSNVTCCSSLHRYISEMQQQKLITNLQALECVSLLGSMLQKRGVTSNIYDLCGIYLKDFSLQGAGDQGCLLNSLPSDVMITSSSGITFTCDLNDNIAAPWMPMSTSSLCSGGRPNISFPKIPQSAAPLTSGTNFARASSITAFVAPLLILVILSTSI
ncbi:uncharacterized GPI-anchored protein At1g61900 [Selaginella moellendorffii]|uniref:uncharacterized GPI-anchored protein At1g61900 n=1 Tax=Selaginella moellendorffii TaxID=88036 RepID=UPI000D1CBEF0|nr:uncharacterized GPI-anchored protein At1g61900 [Selaginella moellendorffii]|eukprot:XP_024539303.1 uncharacterized GPI-anchored protein At1g61900 [Selaginella moellendorffii]